MKKIFSIILFIFCIMSANFAHAQNDISITLNNEKLIPQQPPLIIDGRTLVPVRTVCEAMQLDVNWDEEQRKVLICDEFNLITLKIDSNIIDVNGEEVLIDSKAQIINGCTMIPIRYVVEPFGAQVLWNGENKTIDIISEKPTIPNLQEENIDQSEKYPFDDDTFLDSSFESPANNNGNYYFYSQPDEEWAFDANGRGYCWVCSYAMIISNITGMRITPLEIAQYNIDAGSAQGNYMANHFNLAQKYNLEFVPAISEESIYFDRFETNHRGATYIIAETDEEVLEALNEAVTLHEHGVMVRFEGYPHTMVAIKGDDGNVYFNDPASPEKEMVPFAKTCLSKNFVLTDISFIQALDN